MIYSYLKPFGMGVVAGMRSMMAPAVLSHKLSHTMPASEPHSALEYAANPTTATVLKVLAVGELIGDKLPNTPNRTDPPGLGFRMLSGGTCGALLNEAEGQSAVTGAVAGGVGAVVGSFLFMRLRLWLDNELGLPDPLVALAEDALTITAGWLLVDGIKPAAAAES